MIQEADYQKSVNGPKLYSIICPKIKKNIFFIIQCKRTQVNMKTCKHCTYNRNSLAPRQNSISNYENAAILILRFYFSNLTMQLLKVNVAKNLITKNMCRLRVFILLYFNIDFEIVPTERTEECLPLTSYKKKSLNTRKCNTCNLQFLIL